jgi:hypothetical protein
MSGKELDPKNNPKNMKNDIIPLGIRTFVNLKSMSICIIEPTSYCIGHFSCILSLLGQIAAQQLANVDI